MSILKTKKTDILSIDPQNIYVKEGFNVRTDMGDLDALAMSIATVGQQVPVKVSKDRGVERYRVIDGHRRYAAVLLAIEKGHPIPYVKAELFSGNAEDELLTMIVTGTGQKALNEVEQGEGLKRLVDLGYKPDELSVKIGKSVSHVVGLLKIANLPKRVKDLVATGKVSGNTVITINKTVTDENELYTQVKKAITTATENGVKAKKATTKHFAVKELSPTDKLKQVYERLIAEGKNGIQTDIFELVLFKTKTMSVDDIWNEVTKEDTK